MRHELELHGEHDAGPDGEANTVRHRSATSLTAYRMGASQVVNLKQGPVCRVLLDDNVGRMTTYVNLTR